MSKLFQALLSGMFFTFIVDFFLFLGIKENYINAYDIKVYYNVLFADHQNIFLFTLFSILLGYVIIYLSNKISIITVGTLFFITATTLIPPVGHWIGAEMLMKKNITLKTDKFSYHGNLLYNGRNKLTFYDNELKKVIILPKNQIIGKY